MALVTKRKSVSASGEATPVEPVAVDSATIDSAPVDEAPANEAAAAAPAATPPVFDAASMSADTTSTSSTPESSAAGDDVAELRSSLNDLQAMVATLMAKTDRSDVAAPDPLARDSDAASRIIVAANHAADATIESARAEAEDLITTAKAKSFEIIGVARELADQELAAERERVARGTADWATTRAEITDRLVALESSMGGYQADLVAATAAVRAAIEQLRPTDDEALRAAADGTSAVAGVAADAVEPAGDQPIAETDDAVATPLPGTDEGVRRSNLFGGDIASRRAAEGPLPSAPVVGAAANGAAANGAAANGTNGTNGAAEPGKLRAGFFGR